MEQESDQLKKIICEIYDRYSSIDDNFASICLSEDKWSLKEIFGHLIDSAANNYQRFIRLQEVPELIFPGYDYNWIKIVKYNTCPFPQIIELWKQYNLLICHIIKNIDEKHLSSVWKREDGDNKTLGFLVRDYIDHMEIHIRALHLRFNEIKS